MIWGDALLSKMELAFVNGTGRAPILTETQAHYYAFVLHDLDVYLTDWDYVYDYYSCLFIAIVVLVRWLVGWLVCSFTNIGLAPSRWTAKVCGSTNFTSADNPRPQASGPRTVGVRNCKWRLMSADRPHPQVGLDYTVSNRQCLGPHTVKQAFLYSVLQCPNTDQFSNCWELVHWHFRSRLVLQTILVALDPLMVRVRKCVSLADPRTVRVRKKICGSGSANISASAVSTPLTGGQRAGD